MSIVMPNKITRDKRRGAARDQALIELSTGYATLQRGYRAAVDKAVAHLGLSQALALPLVVVGRHGAPLRPGVLAAMLGIEGPSLVRPIAQLVDSGLLAYQVDAVDGRAKTLSLTAAGEPVRERIEAVLHDLRASLYEGISDEDIATCLRLFATVEGRLGRKATATRAQVAAGPVPAPAQPTGFKPKD